MGLFDSLIGAGLDSLGLGGSVESGGGGGQSLADAYKGDGPLGIGELLKGIATAYLKETQGVDETIDRLRALDKAKLDGAIDHMLSDFLNTQFHKENAIADARAARDNNYHTYADEFIPQLHARACSNGLWNSTALQLLANDAYARTVVKAAEQELQTIKDYARIHLDEGQVVNALFGSLINAYQNTDRTQTLERRPDIGEFAEDFTIVTAALTLFSLFGKRNYLADKVGGASGDGNEGLWSFLPGTSNGTVPGGIPLG